MKTIMIALLFIYFLASHSCFTQGAFNSSVPNFECAGYLTEIVPANNIFTPAIVLYARTDIGGVYKSTDNGNNWAFISKFAPSPAALMTQGLAVQPNSQSVVLVACGVSYLGDGGAGDIDDQGRGIWKTSDGGDNWMQVLGPSNINFGGNNAEKLGGECIIFDPSNSNIVYAGGRKLTGNAYSHLYKSTDAGNTWTDFISNVFTGHISSIVKRGDEIWVGTVASSGSSNAGIWRSTNSGSSWTQIRNNSEIDGAVYRILLRTSDNSAYVAHGTHLTRYNDNGTWSANISNSTSGSSPLTALMFIKHSSSTDEDWLLVSRQFDQNTYYTTNEGSNWISLPLNLIGNIPKHSIKTTEAFSGKTNFSQNPNNFSEWYVSNGAAPLKTTDAGNNWSFIPNGINMPVIYDIVFGNENTDVDPPFQYIHFPMSDWTLAYANVSSPFSIEDYERYSGSPGSDAYYSNGTRVLTTQASGYEHIAFMTTGNIYTGYVGALLKSTNYGAALTFTVQSTNLPIGSSGHTLVDGLYSQDNGDDIIVMVGGGESRQVIGNTSNWGVFRTTSDLVHFDPVTGVSGADQTRYEGSLVPALFDHSRSLAADPFDTDIKYMYLEKGPTSNTGGFFKSNNKGATWDYIEIEGLTYNKGSITCDTYSSNEGMLYLAVLNQGLYTSTDKGESWNAIEDITSAEQVVCWIVPFFFGKVDNEPYNRIYDAQTLQEITDDDYKLPSTTSLTIKNNELWIGTAGQGVFVYVRGEDVSSTSKIISLQEYKDKLKNNYPNPFNPNTKIKYTISNNSFVKLTVYDLLGKEVSVLVNNYKDAGSYEVLFNGSKLASGVYIYKIESIDLENGSMLFTEVKKMVLIK